MLLRKKHYCDLNRKEFSEQFTKAARECRMIPADVKTKVVWDLYYKNTEKTNT